MAADVHQTAHCECDDAWSFKFPIRSGLSKTGDGGHDQFLIELPKRRKTEVLPVKKSHRLILEQHIGTLCQPLQGFLVIAGLQVENDAVFIRMIRGEGQAFFRVRLIVLERSVTPHRVAVGSFYENDFRA